MHVTQEIGCLIELDEVFPNRTVGEISNKSLPSFFGIQKRQEMMNNVFQQLRLSLVSAAHAVGS